MLQDLPICFDCTERIDHSPVFEALCSHPTCPSAVFHGVCLMRWREKREEAERMVKQWFTKHTEYGPRRPKG